MYIGSAPKEGDPIELVCDTVVLAAEEYQPSKSYWKNVGVIRAPMDDCIPMRKSDIKMAIETADFVSQKVLEGNTILSTCAMGVNRSSLIAALTILNLHPHFSYNEIIDLIRATRGSDLAKAGVGILPLSNTDFVKLLRKHSMRDSHGRVYAT